MRNSKILGMIGMAAMLESSMQEVNFPDKKIPTTTRGKYNSILTVSQRKQKLKNRAANKVARKQRKLNV